MGTKRVFKYEIYAIMSEGSPDTGRFAKTLDRVEKSGIRDLQPYSHHLRPVLCFSLSRGESKVLIQNESRVI